MIGNCLAVGILALFVAAGLAAARRALPQENMEVVLPLGCGFGVSLLAAVPALCALALGFTRPAVVLACAIVLLLGWRLWRGLPRPGPDWRPMLCCVLPLFAVTCYLLSTHVLHEVGGAYRTGQSCYGDMAMHLGFIKHIAVTGKFPPDYPLLGGEHRFGYPFLCESVSSVFLLVGADLRTAYLLPMLCLLYTSPSPRDRG